MRKWERDTQAVKIIQQALKDLPGNRYPQVHSFRRGLNGVQQPDGTYGDKTVETVRQFQTDQLFPPDQRDGQVGHDTLCRLDSLFGGAAAPVGSPAAAPAAPAAPGRGNLQITLPQPLDRLRDAILADPPIASGQSKHYVEAPVHVVMLHDSAGMKIITRGNAFPFSTIRGAVESDPEVSRGVAVSGSFGDFLSSRVATGFVVKNGAIVNGSSFTTGAFLSFGGAGHHFFGRGNPPLTVAGRIALFALGGLVPMILGGAAVTGDAWYSLNNVVTGRCVVAGIGSAHQLAVIVQADDAARFNLDALRDLALSIGADDAVGLDGSTSAMLRHRNGWLVRNTAAKNSVNENAVGFYGFQ